MEKEIFVSGYCRGMDCARTVAAVVDETLQEVDCDFPNCPYATGCTIGNALSEYANKQKEMMK